MSKFLKATALAALIAGTAQAGQYNLGRDATPEEVAAWDIDVRPDGAGLPEGSGDVVTGEELFIEQCAVCHGDFAEGVDRWPVLAGGQGTLTSDRPVKTIGSYWPYLSTVWDYVHRAMPFGNAQSLSDDEVYAITAYLLYANDLVDDDFELSHETFQDVRLPNEDGFFPDDRLESPVFAKGEVCMYDCKEEVEITMRAAVLDVTPEETAEREAREAEAEAQQTAAAPTEDPEPEPAALDADLLAHADKVWKKCKACHQVGDGARNRVGPVLNGTYGQPAGAADGFKYSGALTEAAEGGLVWDDASLDAFLTKPKAFLKGTKMSFAGLKKEEDRAAIIELLKSVAE